MTDLLSPPLDTPALAPDKFRDPDRTLDGSARAVVPFGALHTLWFNTGTLCNIECRGCYIESSPRNDRLVYLTAAEVGAFLDEVARDRLPLREVGFTGGEPFMNPEIFAMLERVLGDGLKALVLTNAMRPMLRSKARLLALRERYGERLTLRVSLDHPTAAGHETMRGPRTFAPAVEGLRWLAAAGFRVHVAARLWSGEGEAELRRAYAALFAELGLATDAFDPAELMLFPEMDAHRDVPEISTACWDILGVRPDDLMCASSRMVVKRRGAASPEVVACTLLPYDPRFALGPTLAGAAVPVKLNHPHCARFCVLGGASCARS